MYKQRYMDGSVRKRRQMHEFKQGAKVRSSTRARPRFVFLFLSREDIDVTRRARARDIAGNERADVGKKLESGRWKCLGGQKARGLQRQRAWRLTRADFLHLLLSSFLVILPSPVAVFLCSRRPRDQSVPDDLFLCPLTFESGRRGERVQPEKRLGSSQWRASPLTSFDRKGLFLYMLLFQFDFLFPFFYWIWRRHYSPSRLCDFRERHTRSWQREIMRCH